MLPGFSVMWTLNVERSRLAVYFAHMTSEDMHRVHHSLQKNPKELVLNNADNSMDIQNMGLKNLCYVDRREHVCR